MRENNLLYAVFLYEYFGFDVNVDLTFHSIELHHLGHDDCDDLGALVPCVSVSYTFLWFSPEPA